MPAKRRSSRRSSRRRRKPTKLRQMDKLQSNKPVVDASNYKKGRTMKGRNGKQRYKVVTSKHPTKLGARIKKWLKIK